MRPIAKSRVSQSQSREMSQSLVVTSQGGLPLHRSSSFHQNQTSEDESGDDYSETAGETPQLTKAAVLGRTETTSTWTTMS